MSICRPLKRSLPCFDLMSMATPTSDDNDCSELSHEEENNCKRVLSMAFGWDHYKSHDEDNESLPQYWRQRKIHKRYHHSEPDYNSTKRRIMTQIKEAQKEDGSTRYSKINSMLQNTSLK